MEEPLLAADEACAHTSLVSALEAMDTSQSKGKVSMGIFLKGPSGTGKGSMVRRALSAAGYQALDMGQELRKDLIDKLANGGVAQRGVLALMTQSRRKSVCVLRVSKPLPPRAQTLLPQLAKLLRAKTTPRQQREPHSTLPVICICDSDPFSAQGCDLEKSCAAVITLPPPSSCQIRSFISAELEGLCDEEAIDSLVKFAGGSYHQARLAAQAVGLGLPPSLIQTVVTPHNVPVMPRPCDGLRRLASARWRSHAYGGLTTGSESAHADLAWHENLAHVVKSSRLDRDLLAPRYARALRPVCDADIQDRTRFGQRSGRHGVQACAALSSRATLPDTPCSLPSSKLAFTRVLTQGSAARQAAAMRETVCARFAVTHGDLSRPGVKAKLEEQLDRLDKARLARSSL